MKNENEMDALFDKWSDQWDVCELQNGHEARFLEKLTFKKKRRNYWQPLTVAASILIIASLSFYFMMDKKPVAMDIASAQTREADSVFTAVIKMEMEKVKKRHSPENEKIIADALVQMKSMDADYEKIKNELLKNGESEQIIHAMIRNLRTRISFLEHVLLQIENNDKLKLQHNENTL